MPIATKTLTGTYEDLLGNPESGYVLIYPSVNVVVDNLSNVIISGPIRVNLVNGTFTTNLPITDSPDTNPTNFGYTVKVVLNKGLVPDVSFGLPAAVVSPLDIRTLVSSPDPSPTWQPVLKGDKGDTGNPSTVPGPPGPANTLGIGTVTSDVVPAATITGAAPNQTLNLVLAKGDKGDTGNTGPAGGVNSVNTKTGNVTLNSADVGAIPTTEKGAASGVATLDASGVMPTAQLPPLAINDTFSVASQAAMLALTAQTGDVAIRSDVQKTFLLAALPASTLANWKEVLAGGGVSSVNGYTGVVSLVKADVGLGSVDNTTDVAKPVSTATQTALDAKAAATKGGNEVLVSVCDSSTAGTTLACDCTVASVFYAGAPNGVKTFNITNPPVGLSTPGVGTLAKSGTVTLYISSGATAYQHLFQGAGTAGNVIWLSGTAPTFAANKLTICTLILVAANQWYGTWVQQA